jgi:hypothetical protein
MCALKPKIIICINEADCVLCEVRARAEGKVKGRAWLILNFAYWHSRIPIVNVCAYVVQMTVDVKSVTKTLRKCAVCLKYSVLSAGLGMDKNSRIWSLEKITERMRRKWSIQRSFRNILAYYKPVLLNAVLIVSKRFFRNTLTIFRLCITFQKFLGSVHTTPPLRQAHKMDLLAAVYISFIVIKTMKIIRNNEWIMFWKVITHFKVPSWNNVGDTEKYTEILNQIGRRHCWDMNQTLHKY